jgi:hypothetical protein
MMAPRVLDLLEHHKILENISAKGTGSFCVFLFSFRRLASRNNKLFTVLPKNGHLSVENICRRYESVPKLSSDSD